jgi:hypothetical protein
LRSFQQINDGFATLFDSGVEQEDGASFSEADNTGFTKSFGWLYNAKMVSEFENISLNEAFELPALQFLNALQYIKSKRKFDEHQYSKSASRGIS